MKYKEGSERAVKEQRWNEILMSKFYSLFMFLFQFPIRFYIHQSCNLQVEKNRAEMNVLHSILGLNLYNC